MDHPEALKFQTTPQGALLEKSFLLAPEHDAAITFVALGSAEDPTIIKSHGQPHKTIYNVLRRCKLADAKDWNRILNEYDSALARGKLDVPLLAEFSRCYLQHRGFPRYSVVSGRAWPGLKTPALGQFGGLAFWNDRSLVSDPLVNSVRSTFKLIKPTLLGFAGGGRTWLPALETQAHEPAT